MKNSFKIKSLIATIMVIMILLISTVVTAETEGNYSVGMSLTSNSKLKEGDTVTISVNLSSVNAGNGIDTIAAAIDYDENVFETISSSSFLSTNEWTPTYAPSTKMLTLLKNTKVKAPEAVLNINLKVKSTISVESTTVTLKEIVVSGGRVTDGGTGDINVGNASVTISKAKDSVPSTEQPKNNTTGSNITNNTTKKSDNTASKKSQLPKAGLEQYGTLAILVLAVVAIFSFVLYKEISKDVK